jgi:class 3 adenylate cyclase/archaellum biogenesis ATPase FlaH
MQAEVARFKVQIPGLEDHIFSSGTVILLTGRPALGKSAFAKQFCLEGLKAGDRIVAILTDTSADNFRQQIKVDSPSLDLLDCLLEKPSGVHEISIRVHELISRTPDRPVRLIVDSLSTLGTMFNPALLAPWLLDLRAMLLTQPFKVLALVNYATGINPSSITRSLHPFADIILEMKMDDTNEEPERQFRVFAARGLSHSAKWIPFAITDSGIEFTEVPSTTDEIGKMLIKVERNVPGHHRVFATVLFFDIAMVPEQRGRLGDQKTRKHLTRSFDVLREEISRFQGRVILTTQHGALVIFDRPEQALQSAWSVKDRARALNLDVRAGIHSGEVQLIGKNVAGIAVHIGARVASLANPGEVLVSSTVKNLVAGSELEFADRGLRALKDIPGEWHLYAVSFPIEK